MNLRRFPFEHQLDAKDCGPACLKIVAKHYGAYYSLQYLREKCGITKDGVSMLGISIAAESIGLRTMALKCTLDDLLLRVPLPAILFWNNNHFVVVYKTNKKNLWVSDPAKGLIKYSIKEFEIGWLRNETKKGVLLALEPSVDFKKSTDSITTEENSMLNMLPYFTPYKKHFFLIFFIMLALTTLQGLLPFISKSIIDIGINTSDIKFIYMMLIGNVGILLSIMIFNAVRDCILMHITARVNIALISDYLVKLMNLPVTFFENKLLGDILQRAQDHERIRSFIMNNSLSMVFSVLTFAVFSIILLIYSNIVFYLFITGSAIYIIWILIFMKLRKKLDWHYFELISKNQSYWVETVSAIQEIKIYNYEHSRRWKWENLQAKLYHVNKRVLAVSNIQCIGGQFIESIKNMTITFFCAIAVIRGELTFGAMISTQFIIGMLNGPLIQFVSFIISAQYAKISFLRMNEIRQLEGEEEQLCVCANTILPTNGSLYLNNVMFRYAPHLPLVLYNINLYIPENKVTAIVGGSGCGKTTLLKLLVRLYKPSYGNVKMGEMNLDTLKLRKWRDMCGVVMQDGKIFNDTIKNNIVLGDDMIDEAQLVKCCEIAQINNDINHLPNGFETIVGEQGRGLSGGQKQRLLIARALYRNPRYLFLDEATNSLDAVNERNIVQALNSTFENRTVVIIAHRLSTIRNAHQIVMMEKGQIVEIGNHKTLMERKGPYYELVNSQNEKIVC